MLSIARILLPMDFSKRAYGAYHYALVLARQFDSELLVVHVLPRHDEELALDFGGAILNRMLAARHAEAQRWLDSVVESDAPARARTLLRQGDAAEQIVTLARQEDCGLIVMATHGHGIFRRYLLGPLTAKVLHDADRPVWTGVHLEEAPPPEAIHIRRVACALSLHADAARVAGWAAAFAAAFQAELCLVHVPRCRADADTAASTLRDVQQALPWPSQIALGPGEVVPAVAAAVRRMAAQILIIGRRAGAADRLRSPSYELIRESPCPVISI